jgi:outer membrane protein
MTLHARILIGLSVSLFMASLVFPGPSVGEGIKIAKLDRQLVYRNSEKIKAAVEDVRKVQTEAMPKLNALAMEINKLQKLLQEGKDTLAKEEQERLDTELKKKAEDLKAEQESVKVKVSFKQKSAQNGISSQLQEVVERIGKEEGFTIILAAEAVLFGAGVTDITDKVTKALDTMPATEKTQP